MQILKNRVIKCIPIALLLFGVLTAGAQKAEFGLRFMPTFSSFDVRNASGGKIEGEVTLGFGFGALLGFNFSNHFGVQGEVIYSSLAQKYTERELERRVKLKYVNIPLLLSLNTGKTNPVNFNIVAGPQLGIRVGSSLITSGDNGIDNPNAVLSAKKGDIGFAFGAGIDFGLNTARTIRLAMGYRGVRGLLDISDNSKTITTDSYYLLDRSHVKTNAIYVGLSILF